MSQLTEVEKKVRETLSDCDGIVDIRVIPYAHLNGEDAVLVETESLESSMSADCALDDALGKEYITHSQIDGVLIGVTVVGSESHKRALRHSKLSKPV